MKRCQILRRDILAWQLKGIYFYAGNTNSFGELARPMNPMVIIVDRNFCEQKEVIYEKIFFDTHSDADLWIDYPHTAST